MSNSSKQYVSSPIYIITYLILYLCVIQGSMKISIKGFPVYRDMQLVNYAKRLFGYIPNINLIQHLPSICDVKTNAESQGIPREHAEIVEITEEQEIISLSDHKLPEPSSWIIDSDSQIWRISFENYGSNNIFIGMKAIL